METAEQTCARILARLPGSGAVVVPNPGPAAQHSIAVGLAQAREAALLLRDDPELRLDTCSNVTGIDWPKAGHLEVVYHLYSTALGQGPVVLRLRTADRAVGTPVPSLTPVWRSCEFQEREVFDLFGIAFEGHPDLRRILMWDEFRDHPMRRDYVEPDDYEWEPTPHGDVQAKAQRHRAGAAPATGGAAP